MNISGEIIFENVSFQYPDPSSESIQTPIKAIDSIDLKIQPGEVVALVGPSGAGKQPLQDCSTDFTTQLPAESFWMEKIFAMYHSLN